MSFSVVYLGGETNRDGTLLKQKVVKISIANLRSSMAERTCARHQKANMEDTKEKQEEESEGQVGQHSMEETCGS